MSTKVNLPSDLLNELKKLKSGHESMEKEVNCDNLMKKCPGVAELTELDSFRRKNVEDFIQERQKITAKLHKIRGTISYFCSAAEEARDPQNRQTACVIETVKKAMEEVESLISAFKESQSFRFNELSAEEKILDQEIIAFDRKLEMWTRPTNNDDDITLKPSKAPIPTDRDVTNDLPPEIAQFHRFVDENGGPQGGWDEEDHEMFLKNWSDHKSDEDLSVALSLLLPTRSEMEIFDHVRWYRRYLELMLVKKNAIARWKEDKKRHQKQQLEAGKTREQELDEVFMAQKLAAEERAHHERTVRRQQLNAWRVERELERLKGEEKKAREDIEKQIKSEKNRMRQLEIKEQITALQEEKKKNQEFEKRLVEEEKRLEEQARKARLEATRPKVELRNRILMEEKLERERIREAEKIERQLRIKSAAEKLKPEVKSDPYRVLQPTKGWEHRVRSAEPSVNRNVPPNLARVPHRAVPAWRQGPV